MKSIELANPLDQQQKHYLINRGSGAYSYRLDPSLSTNRISVENVEQINLEKIKSDRRQAHRSNSLNKKRPMTAKPFRNDEFEPSPWAAEEKATDLLSS